ncbi:LOW QUALITY PROTEIN: protein fuzzy homolog [Taeniopygia guttata]|uniref:LOW QUALITY PROTEIN: protein fuzzy homolog n=1 Tax=Taeniopygia guttata TaxID=59729 RepID=UPI003BB8708F
MDEEGVAFLVGVATASGLPLFCRPPRPQVPFPLVGALHGVHLFGAAAGAELRQAATPTAHLGWAGYGDSLTLIGLSPGPAPARILDSAFGAMFQVLLLGREQLLLVRNEERLKRELRGCFPLLDSLLSPGGGVGDGRPLLAPPPQPRPRRAAGAAAPFRGGCRDRPGLRGVGRGRAWLSTAPWGALPEADSAPLRALLALPPPEGALRGGVAARDLPVFLPNSSPEVPLRLLQLRLLPGVGVGLLCGPRPSLQLLLTQLVPQFWGPVLEQLRARPRPPPAAPPSFGVPPDPSGPEAERDPQRGWNGFVTPPRTPKSEPRPPHCGALPPPLRAAALRRLLRLLEPQICPKSGGRGPHGRPKLCYLALPTHTGCCLLRPDLTLLLLLPPGTPRDPLSPTALSALSALGHG